MFIVLFQLEIGSKISSFFSSKKADQEPDENAKNVRNYHFIYRVNIFTS